MSGSLKRIGFVATLAIALILAANVIYEPTRQRQAQADYKALALSNGAYLYAYYCAECHGAALDQEFVRSRETNDRLHTIAYGRYGTDMFAYAADFWGSLTMPQVVYLVRLLQCDEWEMVSARVAVLGLMPEAIPITAAQDTTIALDYDQALGLFSTHCAECHGENGEGIPENGPVLVVVPPLRARTMMNFVRVGSAQTPGIPAEIVSNMELEQIIAYIHSLSE